MTRAVLAIWLLFGASPSHAKTLVVEAFGDSLFAGYGLAASDAFPARLQMALQHDGMDAKVISAAVSGDTIADGVQRLDWMLQDHPDVVIVELGGNDVLRGLPPVQARAGLEAICSKLAAAHVRFILAGMMAPGNMGPQYAAEFDAIYPDLARKYDAPLYPFVLQDIIFHPDLMQADGIHPNVVGEQIMVRGLLPLIETELRKAG